MKTCIKCGELKEIIEFYRHTGMTDGHLNKCKRCCRIDSISNRRSKIEYYKAYDRNRGDLPHRKKARDEYNKTDAYKKSHATSNAKWSRKNKYKKKSHCRVKRAVYAGKIQKQPCLICGSENVQAHHEDYSKPLDVIWLCSSCHAKRHKEKRLKAS
jgi:hypothetical protein